MQPRRLAVGVDVIAVCQLRIEQRTWCSTMTYDEMSHKWIFRHMKATYVKELHRVVDAIRIAPGILRSRGHVAPVATIIASFC
jgi:hypothetical protein